MIEWELSDIRCWTLELGGMGVKLGTSLLVPATSWWCGVYLVDLGWVFKNCCPLSSMDDCVRLQIPPSFQFISPFPVCLPIDFPSFLPIHHS